MSGSQVPAGSRPHSLTVPAPASGRRVIIAGGCLLAAAALALGSAQASGASPYRVPAEHKAAGPATPSPGWHSYNPGLPDGSPFEIYAPSVSSAWGAGETQSGASAYLYFNGASWQSMSGPDVGPLAGISGTSSSDLWVISATESAHYNGTSWATYPLAIPAGESGLGSTYVATDGIYAASATDAYAEVDTVTSNGGIAEVLERFNGSDWSVITGAPNISVSGSIAVGVTGSGPDDIYVTANYDNDNKSEVLHYNGSVWAVESLPGTPFGVTISVTGTGTAMAMGYDESGHPYAAGLSDGTWSLVSLPSGLGPIDSDLSSSGQVWTQMQTSSGSDGPITLWKYSGGTWTQITPNEVTAGLIGITGGGGIWATGDGVAPSSNLFVS
jgi:hypothetical protein